MPLPDPSGRLAALQTASQGIPASPGENPGGPPGQSPLGPNVEPELPGPLEERAAQEGLKQTLGETLARLNVLEQALIARGVIAAEDVNPLTPPAGQQQLLQSGGAPVGPGGPPPGGPAPPQGMNQGPNQPY